MKIKSALFGAALAVTTLVGGAAQAATSLGVDFPAGAFDYGGSVWNLGWSFTANSNVRVVGLGNWAGGPSFPQEQQVGLWNSNGTLLASAYVSSSSSSVGSAPWLFTAITPVALIAGQTYVVGAQGGADYTGIIGNATFDPRITYNTDLYTYNGPGNSPLVMPTLSEGYGASGAGWFGGNIELSGVPEASTWVMMLAGFAGLGFVGYRRNNAASFAA